MKIGELKVNEYSNENNKLFEICTSRSIKINYFKFDINRSYKIHHPEIFYLNPGHPHLKKYYSIKFKEL